MISMVVPAVNHAGILTQALESLAAQDFPVGQFEIIIVDNGSTDGTRVASELFISRHTYLRSGVRELRNAGVSGPMGRLRALAWSLFRPARRWLQRDARWLERHALQQRLEHAYRRGYEFHQGALPRNPVLLNWILKRDYWDLPVLPSGALT